MSHSLVDDVLVRILVSHSRPPESGGSEEEDQEEQGDDDEHVDNDELNGLYCQEEEIEEAQQGKTSTTPSEPCVEKMRLHRLAHCSFRSWCTLCVASRMKSWPHFWQAMVDDDRVPSACIDTCLLRDYLGGGSVPVLVGRVEGAKMVVPVWCCTRICSRLVGGAAAFRP